MLKAGSQQGASASGGDLGIMMVVEVYNKAEWEVSDDRAGRERKSEAHSSLRQFFHPPAVSSEHGRGYCLTKEGGNSGPGEEKTGVDC